MQIRLFQKLKTANVWVVVAISAIIALVLANLLNLIFFTLVGQPVTPSIILFGSIDAVLIPVVIGPPLFTQYRRANQLAETNQALAAESKERQQAESEARRRAQNMNMVHDLAVGCSTLPTGADVPRFIAEKLREITHAFAVSVSRYDPEKKVLVLEHIATSGDALLTRAENIFGFSLVGMENPVSQQDYDFMLTSFTHTSSSIQEVTFGAIPNAVGAVLKTTFGLSSFTGLAFLSKGILTGTAVLINRTGEIPIDHETAVAISRVIAVTMHRHEAENKLHRVYAELQEAYDKTIEGWVRALDLRDHETEGHTQRVTELAVQLARRLGFSEEQIVPIRRGALLHDIGKIGVADRILNKPGPLDEDEWRVMRQHPVLARDMLAPIAYLNQALVIPYYHHEHWDGTGYPQGLSGEQIPLQARLFSIIDVWDALSSDRAYRTHLPQAEVIAYLRQESGRLFDPQVVEPFLELLNQQQTG